MDFVILCAGKGSRLKPITDTIPKCMVEINGKPILQHTIDKIKNLYKEYRIYIVCGYKKEVIQDYYKDSSDNITLVVQKDMNGTSSAIESVESYIKDDFVVLSGDTLYSSYDIKSIADNIESILVVKSNNNLERYGTMLIKDGIAKHIYEKHTNPVSNYVNCGTYHFSKDIFKYIKKTEEDPRFNERIITNTINIAIQDGALFRSILTNRLIEITFPNDIEEIENMMKKERVIITGSSGFIGRHLCKKLHGSYYIIGYDKEIPHPNYSIYVDEFIHGDITKDLFNHENIHSVIHLAAKAGVRDSQEKFSEYCLNNIYGTKCVLDKCVEFWKPKNILLASTSSIYGDTYEPSCETSRMNPKSLYGTSKLSMEYIAKTYKNNGLLDCDICNMRIFTVYGPHQRESLAINKFIEGILNDEEIVVYGDGTQSRDFSYVDDLCCSIEALLKIDNIPFVLNMGFGDSITVNETISIISDYLNKKPKIKYEPMNRFDVMYTKSNPYLLYKTLPDIDRKYDIVQGIINQINEKVKNK